MNVALIGLKGHYGTVLEGLKEGDQVILSDMSRWDNVDRVRVK